MDYEKHIKDIGNRIKHYRISLNMTQQDLAEVSGVSLRSISRLEQGASVQLDNLVKILMALNIEDNIKLLVPGKVRSHPEGITHSEGIIHSVQVNTDKIRKRVRKFSEEKPITSSVKKGVQNMHELEKKIEKTIEKKIGEKIEKRKDK